MNKLQFKNIFLLFIFNNFSMIEDKNLINILNTFENKIEKNFLKINEYNNLLYEKKKLKLKFFEIHIKSNNINITEDLFQNNNNNNLLAIKTYLKSIQDVKYSFQNFENNFILSLNKENDDVTAFINYQKSEYSNKKFITINNIETYEKYQRNSIGRFLMNILSQKSFLKENVDEINLESQYDKSKSNLEKKIIMPDAFYENLGFKIDKQRNIKNLYNQETEIFRLKKEYYLEKIKNNI